VLLAGLNLILLPLLVHVRLDAAPFLATTVSVCYTSWHRRAASSPYSSWLRKELPVTGSSTSVDLALTLV
jgi:hypothetical protein